MAVKGKSVKKRAKAKPCKTVRNKVARTISLPVPEKKEIPKADKRRSDWELNDLLIQQCFWKFCEEHTRPPSQIELAELTGLHRNTIADHYDKKTLYDISAPFKATSTQVLMGQTKKAVDGSTEAAKFWREVVWGEGSKVDIRHSIDDIRAFANKVESKEKAMTLNPALTGLVTTPDEE